MPCISTKGKLMPTARKILRATGGPISASEVSKTTGLPLYRVRASLRELGEEGLIEATGDRFHITESGKQKLNEG